MHQRISPRASRFDYTASATYFVTICTKERRHYFGEVLDGKMVLNDLGDETYRCWVLIEHFHPHVICDEFVCMPNHLHGIILVGNCKQKSVKTHSVKTHSVGTHSVGTHSVGTHSVGTHSVGTHPVGTHPVGTHYMRPDNNIYQTNKDRCDLSLRPTNIISNICKSESLGSIIRGFKIGITQYANHHTIPFARQGRYHDHIIRNEQEYNRIKHYIQTNPNNRKDDTFA